jgi:hypothetical protein
MYADKTFVWIRFALSADSGGDPGSPDRSWGGEGGDRWIQHSNAVNTLAAASCLALFDRAEWYFVGVLSIRSSVSSFVQAVALLCALGLQVVKEVVAVKEVVKEVPVDVVREVSASYR